MLTLGINGRYSTDSSAVIPGIEEFGHDAGACLVRDGELIAALEEERLNRIKHTIDFPANAIRACLDETGVSIEELDAVAICAPEIYLDDFMNHVYITNPTVAPLLYTRESLKRSFREEFDWTLPDDRLIYTPHHLAHAMSSYVRAGQDESLILSLDGRGEADSGAVYHAKDGILELLTSYSLGKSLGFLYLEATRLLGYRFGDEYKVMGLAPYGDPSTYRPVFESIYSLRPDGEYELAIRDPETFNHAPAFREAGFLPRRKGEQFSQQHMDFAAGIQESIEKIVLHILTHWRQRTGLRNLAFGGGVAHNCSLNGVILRSGLFDEVFVHPASHDSGANEGAALIAAQQLSGKPTEPLRLRSASLGPGLGKDSDIEATLKSWSALVKYEKPADIVDAAARLLAGDAVLGWAHGRSEFGPRALGNRSILADARPKENQTRINAMVKKRESFRPFAPVVTAEAAATYFEIPETTAHFDFMSFVVRVQTDRREELGAITHVDGTARVQVVHPEANERFHRLVTRFGELTGTPVLLNTSFNNNAEPIVQDIQDVLTCYVTTDLDYLVVEDFLIRKAAARPLAVEEFVLSFRPVTKLVKLTDASGSVVHEIYLDRHNGPRARISVELYELLAQADSVTPLGQLAAGLSAQLKDELYELWQERFFILTPAGYR
jgi:decarbamoylnovobiocin carbamoyltransferase/7-O-carbamoyltransferase